MKSWKSLFIVFLLLTFYLSPSVHARAGGNTSSPSFSSSSSHTHTSLTKNKDKERWLNILISFGGFFYLSYYTQTYTIRKIKKQHKEAIKNLQTKLPYDLRGKVIDLYYDVQNAWKNEDMVEIKKNLSLDLANQWQTKLAFMELNQQKNVMSMIHIINVFPFAVIDNHIFYRIHGIMIDYIEDINTNKLISGSKTPKPFREYWEIELYQDKILLTHIYQEDELPLSNF